jgi:putative ABC transport system ATP-binding protein
VQQLIKDYGRGVSQVHALRDVSVGVRRGLLTVVVGPSGAGKSTLLRCMAGLESPTTGSVTVADRSIAGLNVKQLAAFRREMVGLVFPSHNLLTSLSVQDNIVLPFSFNDRALDDSWYDRVVATLQVADVVQMRPEDLTKLQQLRVACARAVVTRPGVIIADEPTRELDRAASIELTQVLRACVDTLSQTVVVATNDPAVAASADRVIVLIDGHVTQQLDNPTIDKVVAALRPASTGRAVA